MSQGCWAARLQKSFPLYKAVPLGPAEAMAAQVQGWQAEGIARFQLKLGTDPHEDATRVRAVTRVRDDGALIVADANEGWRLADAMVAARLLEPLDRVIFEEPCKTLDECLHVRRHTSLPMVGRGHHRRAGPAAGQCGRWHGGHQPEALQVRRPHRLQVSTAA